MAERGRRCGGWHYFFLYFSEDIQRGLGGFVKNMLQGVMVKIEFGQPAAPTTENSVEDGMTLSPAAVKRLRELLADKPDQFVRIKVRGGGCNGYTYSLDLDATPTADDFELKAEGEDRILARVDVESLRFLLGSVLEFEETIEYSRFVINNPNAKSACGCGNSFGI